MATLVDFVAALKAHVVGVSDVTDLIGDRFTPMPIPEGQPKPRATYAISGCVPRTMSHVPPPRGFVCNASARKKTHDPGRFKLCGLPQRIGKRHHQPTRPLAESIKTCAVE